MTVVWFIHMFVSVSLDLYLETEEARRLTDPHLLLPQMHLPSPPSLPPIHPQSPHSPILSNLHCILPPKLISRFSPLSVASPLRYLPLFGHLFTLDIPNKLLHQLDSHSRHTNLLTSFLCETKSSSTSLHSGKQCTRLELWNRKV